MNENGKDFHTISNLTGSRNILLFPGMKLGMSKKAEKVSERKMLKKITEFKWQCQNKIIIYH